MVDQENQHSDGGEMHEATEKVRAWEQQNAAIDQLLHGGMRDTYVPAIDVDQQMLNIACMDERLKENRIGIAGSGVLWNAEQEAQALRMFMISGRRPTGISRHAGCGAEGLAESKLGLMKEQIQAKALALAEKLHVPYTGLAAMENIHFHPARVLTLVNKLDFDVTKLAGIRSFLISARYTPTAIAEADIGASIALGDHGLGEMFSSSAPFVIVVIGDRDNPVHYWERSAEQLHDQPTIKANAAKIFITGFNA